MAPDLDEGAREKSERRVPHAARAAEWFDSFGIEKPDQLLAMIPRAVGEDATTDLPGLLRQFQEAYAEHGSGGFLAVCVPAVEGKARVDRNMLPEMTSIHGGGHGNVGLPNGKRIEAAFPLVGVQANAEPSVELFKKLAASAGSVLLALPIEGFDVRRAGDPQTLWLDFVFASLWDSDHVTHEGTHSRIPSPFAASMIACKQLLETKDNPRMGIKIGQPLDAKRRPTDKSTPPTEDRDESPIEVFYSYSHKDEKLRDRLESHLSLLKRQGFVAGWHDRKITAGMEWKGQIDLHLSTARLILLLISSDFLASDYCHDVEMRRAMERHESGEARVIPIILRPCDWHSAAFGKLEALPTDGRPTTEWRSRDKALTDIAKGIRAAIEEMLKVPS